MKNFSATILRCAIFVAFICVTICSCTDSAADPFAYVDSPFDVVVDGKVNGIIFTAKAHCDFTPRNTDEAIITAEITSPPSLEGIIIKRLADGRNVTMLDNVEEDGDCFDAVLDTLMLLSITDNYSKIEKNGNTTVYHFNSDQNEIKYIFRNGCALPEKISGKGVSLALTPLK